MSNDLFNNHEVTNIEFSPLFGEGGALALLASPFLEEAGASDVEELDADRKALLANRILHDFFSNVAASNDWIKGIVALVGVAGLKARIQMKPSFVAPGSQGGEGLNVEVVSGVEAKTPILEQLIVDTKERWLHDGEFKELAAELSPVLRDLGVTSIDIMNIARSVVNSPGIEDSAPRGHDCLPLSTLDSLISEERTVEPYISKFLKELQKLLVRKREKASVTAEPSLSARIAANIAIIRSANLRDLFEHMSSDDKKLLSPGNMGSALTATGERASSLPCVYLEGEDRVLQDKTALDRYLEEADRLGVLTPFIEQYYHLLHLQGKLD